MTNPTPFDASIAKFNAMYKLPAPAYPTLTGFDVRTRKEQFSRIYSNELDEGKDIIDKIRSGAADRIDIMTDIADWCGDLAVYATSEALRYGILFDQEWDDARYFNPEKMTDSELIHAIKLFANAQRASMHTHEHLLLEAMDADNTTGQLTALRHLCAQNANHAATAAAMIFDLPIKGILEIIMDSNFSKLGADGQPIYDADNKVQKGPNYWKPEPKIKELLLRHVVLTQERIEADAKAQADALAAQRAALGAEDTDIDPDNLDA